ncbi:MAG TPA: Fur family transcriptional regulator [Ilumatobacteraceae bacterium]|nr:Fur family transcriptional regulator [Ilumatobacteraceae bacterium]
MHPDSVEDVLERVRAHGGRATSARRAILTALFDDSHGHPTAEQLTKIVQMQQPEVAESTVYRFLDELGRLGVVRPVRIGNGPAGYHLSEAAQHHHLHCTSCDALLELPDAALRTLRTALLRDHDFQIETRHLTLHGLCNTCRAEQPGS